MKKDYPLEIIENKETNVPITIDADMKISLIKEGAGLIKEAIQCFTEYSCYKEHEITERKRINAWVKVVCHEIDARKEVVLEVLKNDREEREYLYNVMRENIKVAMERNQVELVEILTKTMVEIYQSSYNSKIYVDKFLENSGAGNLYLK